MVHAQRHPRRVLYQNRVDTLSFGERFSIKANTVDWALLTPSLGLEMTLGNRSWSRWTLGVNGRCKPAVHFDKPPYLSYNLRDVRIDVRRYMHARDARRSYLMGIYALTGRHDIKLGQTGYVGSHLAVGITAGIIMPLFGYRNGSSLDLELTTSIGALFVKHDEYQKEGDAEVVTSPATSYRLTWKPMLHVAIPDVLRLCLVYHFGPSVANRYKRRIAVDENYRLHLNEMKLRRDSTRQARNEQKALRRDSLEKLDYERRFEKQRLELERAYIADSIRNARRQAVKDTVKKKATK